MRSFRIPIFILRADDAPVPVRRVQRRVASAHRYALWQAAAGKPPTVRRPREHGWPPGRAGPGTDLYDLWQGRAGVAAHGHRPPGAWTTTEALLQRAALPIAGSGKGPSCCAAHGRAAVTPVHPSGRKCSRSDPAEHSIAHSSFSSLFSSLMKVLMSLNWR